MRVAQTYIPAKYTTRLARIEELLSGLDDERAHLQSLLAAPGDVEENVGDATTSMHRPVDARLHSVLQELQGLPTDGQLAALAEFVAEVKVCGPLAWICAYLSAALFM